jgi:septum formation protein
MPMQLENTAARVILASASPRRQRLLQQIGVAFRVVVADVDERVLPDESPDAYTQRVARDKALTVLRREAAGLPVLAADTAVVLDGEILGKPADRIDAERMLGRLSGRTHEVYSAIALALAPDRVEQRLNVSRVSFAALEADWIGAYCDTGDPMDKAGAYGVQGRAAEKIARIEGSFSGVMGLPLFETAELLRRAEVLS